MANSKTDSQVLNEVKDSLVGNHADVDYVIRKGLTGHHDEIDTAEALSILRQVRERVMRLDTAINDQLHGEVLKEQAPTCCKFSKVCDGSGPS